MWALADAGVTYTQGKSIASLDSDASAAGKALVEALGSVSVGSEHGASALSSKITTFQTDSSDANNGFVNAVSKLGTNTSDGAKTAAQTNNEGTHVASTNTALARDLNTRTSGTIAV